MLKGQPQPPSLKNIMDLGQNLISRLTVIKAEDIGAIETATVGQSDKRR